MSGPETLEPNAGQALADQAPIDEFTREWAKRVAALEASASDYLHRYGLQDRITLVRTDVGIELRMPDHILFPSGAAGLQLSGLTLVSDLSEFLKNVEGHIQISGHTDNVPIRTDRFPSNWELSAARAILPWSTTVTNSRRSSIWPI